MSRPVKCYFYIVETRSDIGFGITSNIRSRNQKYCSHNGASPKAKVVFRYVFKAKGWHAVQLETVVKQSLNESIVPVEHHPSIKTEWFAEDFTLDSALKAINTLIEEQHLKVSLVETDYHYSQGSLE